MPPEVPPAPRARGAWTVARPFLAPLVAFPPVVAAGAGLGASWGTAAAIAGSFAAGVLVAAVLFRWMGPPLLGAVFLACICGGGLGYESSIATRLRSRALVTLNVAEAPGHPEATLFRFLDGHVLTDREGHFERVTRTRNSTTRTNYFVAPLVPESWRAGDPVPAWVATTGVANSWNRPWRCGARIDVPPDADNGYRRALRKCEEKGLTSVPGAPFVEWVENAEEWPAKRIRQSL